MTLSLISDLLAFTTLHIYWFYMVAARIFHWQLTILYSLFNLFRGISEICMLTLTYSNSTGTEAIPIPDPRQKKKHITPPHRLL